MVQNPTYHLLSFFNVDLAMIAPKTMIKGIKRINNPEFSIRLFLIVWNSLLITYF